LASFAYDPLSRLGLDPVSGRNGVTRGNGTNTSFYYDTASRLQTLSHAGTTQDLSVTFGYTLASQLQTRGGSNNLYEWGTGAANRTYVPDGLNRYASVGGTPYTYTDLRGNLT